ncbi:MAG: beta-lactamase family protein [Candidatus Eremiobacteraeota bacterium]|nr:beta-lactamase family protein [Candidatus Eremiobacteraeota bacterium]
MSRRHFVSLAGGSLGLAPCVSRSKLAGGADIRAEMRWANVPGASITTVQHLNIQASAFGERDLAAHLPVTPKTIFEAASMSKPVFSYAVMDLVRRGGLDLDRPLDAYLSKPYPIDDARGRHITARHVLSHTSGLPNWRDERSLRLPLAFAPGTAYRYSGEGFYFLQTVVEAVSGLSLGQFMRTALDGLGMSDSSYVWQTRYRANSAKPYNSDLQPLSHDTQVWGDQLSALAAKRGEKLEDWKSAQALSALQQLHPRQIAVPHNAMPNAAWSLLTTASDYAKFVRALLGQPHHLMLEPAVRLSKYVWRGLGIALQVDASRRAFFHTGANPGFKAAMFGDLGARHGIASFANSDGGFVFNMHAVEREMGPQPAIFYLEQP